MSRKFTQDNYQSSEMDLPQQSFSQFATRSLLLETRKQISQETEKKIRKNVNQVITTILILCYLSSKQGYQLRSRWNFKWSDI